MEGFVELARACAPLAQVEILAAVVSVESGLNPFAIRVNTGTSLKRQPTNKADAIETASTLVSEGHDLDLGLGGVNHADLRKLDLTLSDAFEPCANLKATGQLLQTYYRAAVTRGAAPADADRAMLVAYYGRGDAELGTLISYDRRIAAERVALRPRLATLKLSSAPQRAVPTLPAREIAAAPQPAMASARPALPADSPPDRRGGSPSRPEPQASAPRWDVFGASRASSLLVYSQGDPR